MIIIVNRACFINETSTKNYFITSLLGVNAEEKLL